MSVTRTAANSEAQVKREADMKLAHVWHQLLYLQVGRCNVKQLFDYIYPISPNALNDNNKNKDNNDKDDEQGSLARERVRLGEALQDKENIIQSQR